MKRADHIWLPIYHECIILPSYVLYWKEGPCHSGNTAQARTKGYHGSVTVVTQETRGGQWRKEMFYLTTHSTHIIYGYMASDIWLRTILIARKETRCRHIGYSLRLTAWVLLYAPSHRQDSTYHGLCCTSHGALAGTRNSSMGSPHEGSIRRPIAPWANALTTDLHLAPGKDKADSYFDEGCSLDAASTTAGPGTTTSKWILHRPVSSKSFSPTSDSVQTENGKGFREGFNNH